MADENKTQADAIAKAVAEGIAKATAEMQTKMAEMSAQIKNSDPAESNIVDVNERRAADEATLRTVDGVLIKEMKLENKIFSVLLIFTSKFSNESITELVFGFLDSLCSSS